MTNETATTPARRLDDHLPDQPLQWEGQPDAARQEHAKTGASLANAMADAAAAYLAHMGTGGGIAAIPHTGPAQYVVAGTMVAISKVLGEQMQMQIAASIDYDETFRDLLVDYKLADTRAALQPAEKALIAHIDARLVSQSQAAQPTVELPTLPKEMAWFDDGRMFFQFGEPEVTANFYTAAQMFDYARAAIAAHIAGASQAAHQPSEKDIPADAPRAFAKRYSQLLEKNVALESRVAELEAGTSQATKAQAEPIYQEMCGEFGECWGDTSKGGYDAANKEGITTRIVYAASVAKEAPAVLLSEQQVADMLNASDLVYKREHLSLINGDTIHARLGFLTSFANHVLSASIATGAKAAGVTAVPGLPFADLASAVNNVRPGVPTSVQVQAGEAELYRTLTGDAMNLGFDSITAALGALRKVKEAPAVLEGFELVPKAFVTEVRRAAEIADSYSPSIDSIDEHGGEECEEPIWQIHHILFYAHAKLFAARKQFAAESVASVAVDATREAADLRTFLLNHITSHEIEGRTLERLTLAHNEVHLLREMLGGSATREAETGVQEVTPQAERPDGCWGISADTSLKTVTLRFDTSDQVLAYYGAVNAHNTAATTSTSRREAIAGAVARGWCTPENASKVLDNDLALAIVAEVEAELASRGRAQGGNTDTESGSDIATTTSTVSAPTEQAESAEHLTMGEAFKAVGGWMNGGELGYPSFGSMNALWAYTVKMVRSYAENTKAPLTVEYVPIAVNSHDEAGGSHPNDKTPADSECQKALDARGDDSGQGLSPYWKWGFRAGWHDHKRLAAPSSTEGAQKAPEDVRNQALEGVAPLPAPREVRERKPGESDESYALHLASCDAWNHCLHKCRKALVKQRTAHAGTDDGPARREAWRKANHRWSMRWRLKKGVEQWQMVDDGEPWGQWGEYTEVIDAAIRALRTSSTGTEKGGAA